MLNSRGQNCRQQVSSLDLSCFKLMKHGSGCGGGGSALHPLLVCREAPQAQQANEGLISLWTASRSRGWSPWHRHTEQDKQTRCPHYILYSCTVSHWGTVVQEVKSGQLSGTRWCLVGRQGFWGLLQWVLSRTPRQRLSCWNHRIQYGGPINSAELLAG